MFDFMKEKPVICAAVLRTVEHVATLRRGDVLSWEKLESLSGFERYTQHWHAYINRVRRDVLNGDRGIKLAAIVGIGLKLLTETEQVNDQSRQRRARRQLNRGIKELRAVPDATLSEHDRTAKHRKIEAARIARREADRAARVGNQVAKPSTNSVPRVRHKKATVAK